MKQLCSILLISSTLLSCRKEEPVAMPQALKLIDKIEIKKSYSSTGNVATNHILFEYNDKKEITKIATYEDNVLYYSYTYVYQDSLPVSSMYDFSFGGDPIYEVKYGYTNGKYSSYYDTYYDDKTVFTYSPQLNRYTHSINGNSFTLNDADDIAVRTGAGNEYAFAFDLSKKGPLYHVVNKKWIPALWYGISGLGIVEMSSYPVSSLFDDRLSELNPYTNTFDADGFITQSRFSLNKGKEAYEINYIYKSVF